MDSFQSLILLILIKLILPSTCRFTLPATLISIQPSGDWLDSLAGWLAVVASSESLAREGQGLETKFTQLSSP